MRITLDRTELMDTVTVDGVREKDPLSVNFREVELKRPASQHRVSQDEIPRPFLIAYREMGSAGYWWFVAAINNVVDPWEMPEGQKMKIPSDLDYSDWYRQEKGGA